MDMKTIEQSFADWEGSTFGFGYGSGEPHVIPALRMFLERCAGDPAAYDFRVMEEALGPVVAWLLINCLCRVDIVEYGTSPRFGWLTPEGRRLQEFVLSKTADELVEIVTSRGPDDDVCYPDACNCGPDGYDSGRICQNPFWPSRRQAAAALDPAAHPLTA